MFNCLKVQHNSSFNSLKITVLNTKPKQEKQVQNEFLFKDLVIAFFF